MIVPPPRSPLFPYTTLFRSARESGTGHLQQQRLLGLCRHGTADRKSTRLNSSHVASSYAVFCLKKKTHRGEIFPHSNAAPAYRLGAHAWSARAENRLLISPFLYLRGSRRYSRRRHIFFF